MTARSCSVAHVNGTCATITAREVAYDTGVADALAMRDDGRGRSRSGAMRSTSNGRLQAAERPGGCRIAPAVGRAESAAEGDFVPVGDVDADLLPEPRRTEPLSVPPAGAGGRQGRAPPAL